MPRAVAETPDEGTLRGAHAIAGWSATFAEAFPDATFELATGIGRGHRR